MDRVLVAAHVAKRLTLRRAELHLSLAQVAARCGVSLQQIHRYEIGDNVLSVGMLWQLSKCLDTTVTYFFEGLD
jgi:transcriptional regulator with XRE-family HTH domain